MKIKVCGMRDSENIKELVKLAPDYIGYIFYDKSRRMVSDSPNVLIPQSIKKVGVFVNESVQNVLKIVQENKLDGIQLHGYESVEYCKKLKNVFAKRSRRDKKDISTPLIHQLEIIKAFSVDEHFDFSTTNEYESVCDLFLFDTKGKNYGGNGVKYDWNILEKYEGNTPFLLSGGIGVEDVIEVQKFHHKKCIGIDLNSGFENEPGMKNIEKLKIFFKELEY